MIKELADQIYPLFECSFIDHGDRIELTNPEDWKMDGEGVVSIFSQYLTREFPSLVDKVVSKHKQSLSRVIQKKVPPFGIFFVVSGAITSEHFLEVLFEGPVVDLYPNFVPENKFVEVLYSFYRQHRQHQEG